jgi:hypothetical protein
LNGQTNKLIFSLSFLSGFTKNSTISVLWIVKADQKIANNVTLEKRIQFGGDGYITCHACRSWLKFEQCAKYEFASSNTTLASNPTLLIVKRRLRLTRVFYSH